MSDSEESDLTGELGGGCPRCGCKGIHACIGRKLEPMSAEEKGRLHEALTKMTASRKHRDDCVQCGGFGCNWCLLPSN